MCKSWCELIIAIVVIVFALWATTYSKWILVVAGIVLLIHSFTCKACFNKGMKMMDKEMPAMKKKRK